MILALLLMLGVSTKTQAQIPFGKTVDITDIVYMDSSGDRTVHVEDMSMKFDKGFVVIITSNASMYLRIDSLKKIMYPKPGITYFAYSGYNTTLQFPCTIGFMHDETSLNSVGMFRDGRLIVFVLGTAWRKNDL